MPIAEVDAHLMLQRERWHLDRNAVPSRRREEQDWNGCRVIRSTIDCARPHSGTAEPGGFDPTRHGAQCMRTRCHATGILTANYGLPLGLSFDLSDGSSRGLSLGLSFGAACGGLGRPRSLCFGLASTFGSSLGGSGLIGGAFAFSS